VATIKCTQSKRAASWLHWQIKCVVTVFEEREWLIETGAMEGGQPIRDAAC
jgi:hypothetical protein